jgi:hypothetical protein
MLFRRTSGPRCPEQGGRRRPLVARRYASASLLALLAVGAHGCIYSFTQGSLPADIRTIAVLPFENATTRLELTQELHDQLLREVPRSLGLRSAGEDVADAILRGRIVDYNVTTPSYRPAPDGERAEVLQRQVTLAVAVELLDVARNEIIWENRTLVSQGEYLEASETEDVGRVIAIRLLRQRIVDGAQSNWQ